MLDSIDYERVAFFGLIGCERIHLKFYSSRAFNIHSLLICALIFEKWIIT